MKKEQMNLGTRWAAAGQIFAQVRFECGLEVRELILRKVKDPTMDIENKR